MSQLCCNHQVVEIHRSLKKTHLAVDGTRPILNATHFVSLVAENCEAIGYCHLLLKSFKPRVCLNVLYVLYKFNQVPFIKMRGEKTIMNHFFRFGQFWSLC